jgi:hypothetical protein
VNPTVINVISYSKNVDAMKRYLTEHGFTEILHKDANDDISMIYRNIVVIKIVKCINTYKVNKSEDDRIASVSLSHIVKRMVKDGHAVLNIRATLLRLATYV